MKLRDVNNVTLEFLTSDSINEVPYFDERISTCFPLPADDIQELKISFDKEIFGVLPSTIFCARISGSPMEGDGISSNYIDTDLSYFQEFFGTQ